MRLIDGDRLEDAIEDECFNYISDSDFNVGIQNGLLLARDFVQEAPTIDAEPVIRCKNCVYFANIHLKQDGTEDNRYKADFCEYHGEDMEEDDFCSKGVRS